MADTMLNVNDHLIVVTPHIKIPVSELHLSFSRSSGPGGQNVNKVNSKVTLRWNVTETTRLPEPVRQRFLKTFPNRMNSEGELVIHSQRYREQERNRADCVDKLRDLVLSVAHAPKARRKTRPTRASRERRLRQKRQRSETKRRRRQPPE
jgi:ribosome-associated protein